MYLRAVCWTDVNCFCRLSTEVLLNVIYFSLFFDLIVNQSWTARGKLRDGGNKFKVAASISWIYIVWILRSTIWVCASIKYIFNVYNLVFRHMTNTVLCLNCVAVFCGVELCLYCCCAFDLSVDMFYFGAFVRAVILNLVSSWR